MKRSAAAKKSEARRWRPANGAPAAPSVPEELTATQFITLVKRGRLADPRLTELRRGRAVRLAQPAGQAAEVLQRLERLLGAGLADSGAVVRVRPLVRLGVADLWRPPLAVFPARGSSALGGVWATQEAAAALLVVLTGSGEAVQARLAGYAASKSREVWVLDLCAGWTVRHLSIWAGKYQSRTLWYPGERVPVAAL
ncbi:MAG: hypothetical protein WDA03_01995, partial [Trueperaceae bacterium]